MLAGLALLIFVVGALHALGLVVISGLVGVGTILIFTFVVLPLSGILMLKGVWLWFTEQWNKRRN